MKCIAAHTTPSGSYPSFVSINQHEDGTVCINLRSEPEITNGIKICDVDCHPGKDGCNGYCNGTAKHAESMVHIKEGKQAHIVLTPDQWEKLKAEILAS